MVLASGVWTPGLGDMVGVKVPIRPRQGQILVTERLDESFANLMDYGFTAAMEEHLDDVAQGERDWKHLLDEFYGDFKKKLEVAETADKGMRANQPTPTDIACRDCGRPMMIRTRRNRRFFVSMNMGTM